MKNLSLQTKIALYTFIILLLGSIFAVISFGVTAKSDIISNIEGIKDCEIKANKLIDSINNHEKRITIIETRYEHISDSLIRIENKLDEAQK